jgi:hypothetical protein
VLSLSYLKILSDKLFSKAELNKKIGLKTSKKGPGAPVIDMVHTLKFYNNFSKMAFFHHYFQPTEFFLHFFILFNMQSMQNIFLRLHKLYMPQGKTGKNLLYKKLEFY